ncbi:hypothetical protein QBC35DRAFT_545659 [Podospora australis]|uniref:Uncharacterized protein n=1 Tax=Podospora australis TaxID=1536484 RepID=A0AAN6WIR3_9PEZI|nr:hypothetical protein QBC35DRAFT_545659 [Podospora australis]
MFSAIPDVAVSREPRRPSDHSITMDLKVCSDIALRYLYKMEDIMIYVLQTINQTKPSFSPVALGCTATFSASAILIPAKYTAALAASATGAFIAGAAVAVPRASYEWRLRSIRKNLENVRILRQVFEDGDADRVAKYRWIIPRSQFRSLRWTLRDYWLKPEAKPEARPQAG